MFNTHRLIASSLFVLFLFSTSLAQENRAPIETPREPVAPIPAAPLVTAAATAGRVRFVSPGTAVQLRLEVYNETGRKLFDTELRGGNVLDWHLQDGAGQRLPAGSYACVLTSKGLSGRLSQRVGLVRINDQEAVVEAAGVAQLSLAQQQAIGPGVGPVEGNAAFAVLQENEAEAITAVTHDGQVGQVTSTAGALTFRTGDLFSGKDKEQMRLTEEGNLGIGTVTPTAKLDVAGMVSAREGFGFSDGSTLNVNDKGVLTRTTAKGEILPNAAGTGTQNRIAKWTDNLGNLGDSLLGETGGGVELHPAVAGAGVNPTLTNAGNVAGMAQLNFYPAAGTNTNMSFSVVPRGTGFPVNRAQFSVFNTDVVANSTNYEFASLRARGSDFVFGTGKAGTGVNRPIMFSSGFLSDNTTNNGQLYLASNGNVGVGTTDPGAKLDVAGTINTSRQYNIDGRRILSNAGTDNLFAGPSAGNSNTSGIFNSFFGAFSGGSNTTGFSNSFFGVSSGGSNTEGSNNSFFGVRAGSANTTGFSNSFFGENAGVHNTTGFANAFVGATAGSSNTEGGVNSFFGFGAGTSNSTGDFNSFFGASTGFSSTTADANSFFGALAGNSNTIGSNNAFFGFDAGGSNVSGGRNVFVGYEAGRFNNGSRNSSFGAEAGMNNTGQDNVFVGDKAGRLNTQGLLNTFIGAGAVENNTTGSNNTALGAHTVILDGHSFVTVIGAGADGTVVGDNTVILGRGLDEVYVPGSFFVGGRRAPIGGNGHLLTVTGNGSFSGTLAVDTLGTVGVEELCRNVNTFKIAPCSSSLRYKTAILPFNSGLSLVNRLRPISFTWKEAGKRDLGLGAEDVEKVEPLLVTYNDKGEVEGVKYDRVAVVLLNAVKEQQVLITKQEQQLKQQQRASLRQQRKLEQQQQQLDALRRLVCKNNPRAGACK